MSKHQLEDPEAEVAATLPRKKFKHHKHAKKDKSESGTATPTIDGSGVDSEITDVSKEKKEKKEKKHKHHKHHHKEDKDSNEAEEEQDSSNAVSDGVADPLGNEVNGATESTEEKPKDKKHKKDKKEKKEKKRSIEEVNDTEQGSEEKPKEKKHKKEKKREGKTDDEEKSNGAATNGETNGHVNGTTSSATYEQTAALTAVAESEISKFLSDNEITITDPLSQHATLRPITQFSYLPTTTLTSKSPFAAFKVPTPIQAASWPFGLSARDIVGVAETGSGKTIAFGLPLVEEVLKMPKAKKGTIRAVVVSPTRELAMQTAAELAKLGGMVDLKTVCVYGGAPKDDQRNQLRKADIIVATPGRLKDFLEEGAAHLSSAKFVVLDEADRMLDKGFEDDIKLIISKCAAKSDRQTLMFTATWPESVRALASTFMNSPVRIQIGGNGSGDLQANTRIEQKVEVVDPKGKEHRLLQILKAQPKNERIIVFCLYKKEATRVEEFLQRRGIKVVGIHGDLRQEQRTRSLDSFKKGENTVLVATDVAARGLDIPEVKLVVNVTFPLTIEDYVHRIGRTGRAGKTGEAITLFTEHDKAHSGELVNILKKAGQPVPEDLMKFGTTVKKKQHSTYGAFFKDVDMSKKGTKITFN